MGRRFSLIVVLSLVLCFLPGCFTLSTLNGQLPGPRVFSGTRAHVMAIASGRAFWDPITSYWNPRGWYPLPLIVWWYPLDVPLSLAADIAILPYTIPAQLAWGNFKEKETEEAPSTMSTEK